MHPDLAILEDEQKPVSWSALGKRSGGPLIEKGSADSLEDVAVGLIQCILYECILRIQGGRVSVEGDPGKNHSLAKSSPEDFILRVRDWMKSPPEGSSVLLETSGSTGLPKSIHHRFSTLARGIRDIRGGERIVWGMGYRAGHMAGIQVILQALGNGHPVVDLFGRERDGFWDLMESQKVTHLGCSPTFFRYRLPPVKKAVYGLRQITFGGEAVDNLFIQNVRSLFPQARIRNVYASTEAGPLFASDGELFAISSRAEGKVKISEGELWIHRDLWFEGNSAEEWIATGDRVEIVQEEPIRFRFLGRGGIRFNVGGRLVHPEQVEVRIRRHPKVRDVRIFPEPNSLMGNLTAAEIVSDCADLDELELRRWLRQNLEDFEVPRTLQFVSKVTQTSTGKIQR